MPAGRTCRSTVALVLCVGAVALAMQSGVAAQNDEPARPPFETWLADLRAEATARGIRPEIVAQALDGLTPLPVVVSRDLSQAEFTLSFDAYLKQRLTTANLRSARRALAANQSLLRRVQQEYGVDPSTIVSIWGIESNYGRFGGVRPTVASLATLAYEPRRSTMFREELFNALQILDRGDIAFADMKGSWAGAMGQPQFMPSSYLKYAVDFDGDQRRDIWHSTADVLGSIANYLRENGWAPGERWGRVVVVPAAAQASIAAAAPLRAEGCRAERELTEPLPLDRWAALGVKLSASHGLPRSEQPASLLRLPGHTFLVYRNYDALLRYNCAHSYALSIALFAERLVAR